MKKLFVFFLTIGLLLTGCTNAAKNTMKDGDEKLEVYTTVYPLQYFAEQIGGDYVNVNTIYPTGADEHTFEPTQKDMIKLADADMFIYIGLGLEGFVEKAKTTLKNENVKMVGAGENIHIEATEHEEEDGEHDEHGDHDEQGDHEDDGHHHHGDIDPHVWIDPIYAKDLAQAITAAFAEKMPEHKEQFEENYTTLSKELDQLNSDFEKVIAESKHKEIIVSHAAFGYWEKRYGLKQISVAGLNTSNEPTQKQLEKIITTAKQYDLKYVFFEQNVNSKLTEIIQKEIGAKPLVLHNLSVLTDDDLKHEPSYFSLMEMNLKALEKALND